MREPADVWREMLRHHVGTVLCDGVPFGTRFVVCPRTGELGAELDPRLAGATEHVLFVPEEREGVLQVLCEARVLAEGGGAVGERWSAYFVVEPRPPLTGLRVVAARWGKFVADADEIAWRNPIAGAEPALCRTLRERREEVAGACERVAGTRPADCTVVGVDHLGVDCRARFGVVRLEFAEPAADAERARALIERVLSGGCA